MNEKRYRRSRTMKDNILIHNFKEEENENLDTKVSGQIKAHINLDVEFIRIHRNGPKHPGNPKPRIVTGNRRIYNDKDLKLQAIKSFKKYKEFLTP